MLSALGLFVAVLGAGEFWGYQNNKFVALQAPNATVVSAASDGESYIYVGYDGSVFRAREYDAAPGEILGAPAVASVCAAEKHFYFLAKDHRRVFRMRGEDESLAEISQNFAGLSASSGEIKFLACGPLGRAGGLGSGVLALYSRGALEVYEADGAGNLTKDNKLSGKIPNGVGVAQVARAELVQLPQLFLENGSLLVGSGLNQSFPFGCAFGESDHFRRASADGIRAFVPFAGELSGSRRTAYLGSDNRVHYCAGSANESVLSGLSESWSGFVAWASGDFIAADRESLVRGNAPFQSEGERTRETLKIAAEEDLEPVSGASSAKEVVIARRDLRSSVPPADPEKPAAGAVSADVARFSAENGAFYAADLSEQLLKGARIAQAVAGKSETLFLTDDGRLFTRSVSASGGLEQLQGQELVDIVQIASRDSLFYFLRADGRLVLRRDNSIELLKDIEGAIDVVAGPGGVLCTLQNGKMTFVPVSGIKTEIVLGSENFTAAEISRVEVASAPVFYLGNGSVFIYAGSGNQSRCFFTEKAGFQRLYAEGVSRYALGRYLLDGTVYKCSGVTAEPDKEFPKGDVIDFAVISDSAYVYLTETQVILRDEKKFV